MGVGVGLGVGVLPTCDGPVVPGPQVSVLLDVDVLDELVTVPLPLVVVGEGLGVELGVLDELTQLVPWGVDGPWVAEACAAARAAAVCAAACWASCARPAAMIAARTRGSIVTRRTMVVVRVGVCCVTGVVTCTVLGTTDGGPATGTSVGVCSAAGAAAAGLVSAEASAIGTNTTACAMPSARADTTASVPHNP
ncbi:hypothetical protein G3T36_02755 [Diaminobutyricibacter tongyongensis]|uniref:Uncharacterized protein n=1 Tax=Leifsonia tongyongensis TaxID=1268043 RepID=A0A6L9XTQ2_9MICO|nr:hypothetical protein [Diaminobutyricibacter tongyongensis]NEN04781.1 hypothetical protein [Diaminobutyricibacter tongyongensis]